MTDLVAQIAAQDEAVLVHPGTGELINPSDIDAVAGYLADIRELSKRIQEARKHAEQILAEHAATIGAKTFTIGDRKIEVKDNTKLGWDLDVLEELRGAGLPEQRWNELVTYDIVAKVNARVAKQIAGSNPAYAQIVERAEKREPGNLYVAVTG